MLYEEPKMMVMLLETEDVITTSDVTDTSTSLSGGNDGTDTINSSSGNNPWQQ